MNRGIALIAAAMLTVSSCASPSAERIQRATVSAIGGDPDQVTVADLNGNANSGYTWRATTPSGEYACNTDYMTRWTFCTPAAPEEAPKSDLATAKRVVVADAVPLADQVVLQRLAAERFAEKKAA